MKHYSLKNAVWLSLLLVLLTFPFLWTKLEPDFSVGLVSLKFAPENGRQFLSVVLPAFAIGALFSLLSGLYGKWRGPRTPLLETWTHDVLEHPRKLALVLLVVLAGSFALSAKGLTAGTFMCIYMILALALNVTIGMTGLLVLGFAAFYAAGAYSFGVLQQWGTYPWFLAIPVSFCVTALLGWLVGLPCLRLRGDYLAIVTLGFAEAFRETIRNLKSTGGDIGISLSASSRIPSLGPITTNQLGFAIALALLCLITLAVYRIYHSRIGRAWIAIREDEIAAASMGIPVVRMKLLAFAISAGIAGVAGSFFASFTGYIDPSMASFEQSVLILAMVILGGLGSIPGSLLGAALLYLIPTLLRDGIPAISDYRLLFFGVLLTTMMLLRPQGILGSPRHRIELEGTNSSKEES